MQLSLRAVRALNLYNRHTGAGMQLAQRGYSPHISSYWGDAPSWHVSRTRTTMMRCPLTR